jgi:iron complex outermembrane receptor protein
LLSSLILASLPVQSEDSIDLPRVEVTSGGVAENSYIPLDKEAKVGKMDVPVEDTPFSISIIDRDFMNDTGAKTIQDALLYSSGVYAGAFGLDTRLDSANIRGIDPSFYLDGLRQVYGSYNSVRTNIYALESIEVLKGPSSVLYGQGELGGIVNSVSKLPKDEQQGEIWAQYGSFNRKQVAFDITGPATEDGKLLYRVVGLQRDSETQVDYVDDDGFLIAPSLTWKPTDDTDFTLLFNRQRNTGKVSAQFLPQSVTLDSTGPFGRVSSDTFAGEPDWDKYDREKTELTFIANHQLDENWKVSTTARYTESSTSTREIWTAIGSPVSASGTIGRTAYMSDKETRVFNLDARLEGQFDIGITKHNFLVGVDRQDATADEDNRGSVNLPATFNIYNPQYGQIDMSSINLNPTDQNDSEVRQVGVYIADHMEIGPVVISTGFRRDWAKSILHKVSGANLTSDEMVNTGRIGAMYRFDNGFSPYASYAEAFNMNLGTDGTGANTNALEPTTGVQREYGFKFLSDDKTFGITAAYFDITQQNRIQQGDTPGGLKQTGASIDGWELQINKRWKQFETQFAYTDMHADKGETGERLAFVAEKLASWWNKYYFSTNWRVGAGVRYIGDTVGFDYGSGAGPEVPSVTLYDAMIGYTYKNWDFSLDAKNLTDNEYVAWCRGEGRDCGFGERRNVTANVRYHF